MSGKLPTVPEEHSHESIYKTVEWCYPDFDLMTATNTNIQVNFIIFFVDLFILLFML